MPEVVSRGQGYTLGLICLQWALRLTPNLAGRWAGGRACRAVVILHMPKMLGLS